VAKDLQRILGFWDAVAIGIASMIGAGIFVVSGIGTRAAGSSVILAFVIAGVVALFNALSSAELAAAIPREGGTYEYARRLLSPKVGFMTGWLFISSKMLESATVALAFASYASLFLQSDPRMFAITAVVILTAINVAGIRSSTNASIIMAIIKVGVLAVFAFLGIGVVKLANYEPFTPTGLQGVLAASAIVFFAYTGYARIATLGEEIKEPEKNIPRAILTSLAIAAIVYIVVTAVGIGLVGVRQFGESDSPIATAASALGNTVLLASVIFGAGVATLSVLLSDLLSSSRTVFAMARNGDFPKFLSQMRNVNPVNSIIATSAIVLAFVLTGSLVQIAALTSLTILIYYAVTNISALKLHSEKRRFPRPIPVAGLISCIGLAVFLPLEQWLWTFLLLALGIVYLIIRKI
jgi:APA family basic amino acid/polyamine antiporter